MRKLLLAVVVAAAMALPLGATALAGQPAFTPGAPSLPGDVCAELEAHGVDPCPLPFA